MKAPYVVLPRIVDDPALRYLPLPARAALYDLYQMADGRGFIPLTANLSVEGHADVWWGNLGPAAIGQLLNFGLVIHEGEALRLTRIFGLPSPAPEPRHPEPEYVEEGRRETVTPPDDDPYSPLLDW